MRRMGFSFHPGALPFVTVRDRKWANRLTAGELIEIHGEHGCDMPSIAAKVVHIGTHSGPPPPHLASVYAHKLLCTVVLGPAPPGWRKVGHPVHGDWVFEAADKC